MSSTAGAGADSIRAVQLPVRFVRGGWPRFVERLLGRFFWADPSVVVRDDAPPEQFRQAMAAFDAGRTIKITGTRRHAAADALLIEHVDLTGATIVDLGASDGSTSVNLVRAIPQRFAAFVIADLYLTMSCRTLRRHRLFYDPQGVCVLVVGRRWVSWPSRSRLVRLLDAPMIRRAEGRPAREVLLLNPETRALLASDDRIRCEVHDAFEPWPEPHPDVIKVANLLRRLYFSDDEIVRGLRAIHASLDDGGHLLMVDNPRANVRPRAGLYRRTPSGFAEVAIVEAEPEVHALILGLTVEEAGTGATSI
ncbi:hypothetical protein [Leifsonia sp. EB34]|uniref:hypothetical protein n=1 Tax=Leifsonia sp. EB34 TaxID=3156303 RepID=UPI0035120AA8